MTDAILKFRIAKLEAQDHCPVCNTYRADYHLNPEHFPESGADGYLFSPGDYVSARYECGSEFVVDDREELRARQCCGQPSIDAADRLQEEADEDCVEAEDAQQGEAA